MITGRNRVVFKGYKPSIPSNVTNLLGMDAQKRIVGSNGEVLLNPPDMQKRVAREVCITDFEFGAVDGAPDVITAIDAAIAAAGDGGIVHIPATQSGEWRYSRAIVPDDGVEIIVHGNTHMVCTGTGAANRWPLYGSLILGSMSYFGAAQPTHNLNNITETKNAVFFTTVADAAQYFVNDVVRIETVSEYGIMDYFVPTFGQYNVVEAVNLQTGELRLRHAMTERITGARIRNMTRTNRNMLASPNVDSGIPARALRDFKLKGGIWVTTNAYGPFAGSSCMIDSSIDVIGTISRSTVGYGNSQANCKLSAQWANVRNNGVELALCSHDTSVKIGKINLVDTVGNTSWIACINESSRNCQIDIGSIVVSSGFQLVSALLIAGAKNSKITVDNIDGVCEVLDVAVIRSIPQSGTYEETKDNLISVGGSRIAAQSRHTYMGGVKCTRNTITGKFFGTLTHVNNLSCYIDNGAFNNTIADYQCEFGRYGSDSGSSITKLKDCYFADGVADDQNNDFPIKSRTSFEGFSSQAFVNGNLLKKTFSPVSLTSTVAFAKSVTIPTKVLTPGVSLDFWIYFESSGSAASKTVSVSFAGTTLPVLTIPAGATDGFYKGTISMASASVAIYHLESFATGGALQITSNPITGLNPTTTEYTLTLNSPVTTGADGLAIRRAGIDFNHPYGK